jgi:hypothetical protein
MLWYTHEGIEKADCPKGNKDNDSFKRPLFEVKCTCYLNHGYINLLADKQNSFQNGK